MRFVCSLDRFELPLVGSMELSQSAITLPDDFGNADMSGCLLGNTVV
jgi:hypothetical protein